MPASPTNFNYRGVLDRVQKIDFLRNLDVLSVPCTYDEPKGLFLLEAMANGVPVVQPRRGRIYGDSANGPAAACWWHRTIRAAWRRESSRCGKTASWPRSWAAAAAQGVREHYSVAHMAARALEVYASIASAAVSLITCLKSRTSPSSTRRRADRSRFSAGVSLPMKRGDAAAIMGPSGVGKSTLLYIVGGLEPPTSGHITLDGRDPYQLGRRNWPSFATGRSVFSFRIIACCRSVRCWRMC